MAMVCHGQVRIVRPPDGQPAGTAGNQPPTQPTQRVQPGPQQPPVQARAMTPDEETMAQARRSLAEGKPGKALSLMDSWLDKHKESERAYVPEAYYLRGNAKLAMDDEFAALYDYEAVIRDYPESEQFVPCLERELQVARLYLNGRNKPSNLFGLRLDDGGPLGEELILRLAERLPGSRLAERALLDLADYYARTRDLALAAEAYDVFLRLYPKSQERALAMQRRVYANIARFKGPGYDSAALKDAMVQIDEFQEEFPAEAQRTGVSELRGRPAQNVHQSRSCERRRSSPTSRDRGSCPPPHVPRARRAAR